ncbi:hypothetical protein BN1723_012191 [Verticillium longisporum]|uniref:Uncharacterized protein n=1 Tax=Verticillium longisporum TaxID=100787 RepID=A0A0G4LFU0_VERLO|nr:hypothetical protein BN1723_012191 [Verticillium longisporum]
MAPRLPPSCLQALRLPARPSLSLPSRLLLPRTSQRGITAGWSTLPHRSKPTRFNQPSAGLPVPTAGPAAALARRELTTPLRTGVLAIKKGMTSVFVGKKRVPATVLQLDQVQAKKKPLEKKKLADYGLTTEARLKVLKVTEPAPRQGGGKVEDVDGLVAKLKELGAI